LGYKRVGVTESEARKHTINLQTRRRRLLEDQLENKKIESSNRQDTFERYLINAEENRKLERQAAERREERASEQNRMFMMMMMQMMSNQRSPVVLPESVVPPPPLRTPNAPTVTGTIDCLPHDAVIDIVDEEDSKYDEDPWRINDTKLAPPKLDQI
jgi:hypothetical protein